MVKWTYWEKLYGKKVCVVPLDTVKPGLKRIFDELKQAEGSYIPDYVTIIDSLTLKIEGLLRFFNWET